MLSQYLTEGMEKPNQNKLSPLLILRVDAIAGAILELAAPPRFAIVS